jgi:glycosyltransferase involved in cell wall biosynthesis
MRILHFGSCDPRFIRNRIIKKGLKENKVEVINCSDYHKIWLRYSNLIKRYKSGYDAMIVGAPGHYDVPLAKLLTTLNAKPLVFEAFISFYDTYVFDTKLVKEGSLRSKFYFYLDKLTCLMSDLILLDTNEHINYFHKEFGIEKKKFKRIFICTDDAIFYPRKTAKKDGNFTITFHGTFIPLHGIEYIVKAAKLLERHKDIEFEIMGYGHTYNKILNLSRKLGVKNVTFKKSVSYEELPNFIASGDVGLGIFGGTAKARRVIPTKASDILAMGKPLITGDSPAIKEAGISSRKNALLVEMANPKAIADGILELKEDEMLRDDIAKNGYKLFKKNFTPKVIGDNLKRILAGII